MSAPKYLIDTNIFIPLEDAGAVPIEFAQVSALAGRHGVGIFIHEAAYDDIGRDKDVERRGVSLSRLRKFPKISKVRDLSASDLAEEFGPIPKPNDLVDATLLHALRIGVADFLITEDRGLHERVQRYTPHLAGLVLYLADALSLLRTTYEPTSVAIPFVEELDAHAIPANDQIFQSLREGYEEFDEWWLEKCVRQFRKCWAVYDQGQLAGLVVRKTEQVGATDATLPGNKILKLCTFKVRAENRGIKLGELLLKQALWFAQTNQYDLIYVTTFSDQTTLIELIEYYGFRYTYTNARNELVYEKILSQAALEIPNDRRFFDAARLNYPRFFAGREISAYVIPIREEFHEVLFPELVKRRQGDLFEYAQRPLTPGNTIRKVYLCRAQANISQPGSIVFFYKGKSRNGLSQAITTVGIFENVSLARSTEELRRMAGGRSVYSDLQLVAFGASPARPVKILNFLLASHLEPAVRIEELLRIGIFNGHPPQSIFQLKQAQLEALLRPVKSFGFHVFQ